MDQLTERHFQSFAIKSATRTEADVQNAIASFLIGAALGIEDDELGQPRLEKQLGDGSKRRIDVMDGRLLIECKRDLDKAGIIDEGVIQVSGYRDSVVSQNGEGYAAVLTDGVMWMLVSPFGSEPRVIAEHRVEVKDDQAPLRLAYWLQSLLGTASSLKPSKENIEQRLATESPNYKNNITLLEKIYQKHNGDAQVQISKHLWSRMLRTALGSAFKDDATLFVRHTFLVCLAEIIAHHVLGLKTSELTAKEIVSGAKFKMHRVTNVVEEDFFDWIAEVPEGERFVQRIAAELAQFDWSTVEHDVLKDLYEAVIPTQVRKELGEYYTPDWLAKMVIDASVTDPLTQRVLDPSCGSGTFIFHAIRALVTAGREAGMSDLEILERAQSHVMGVDIHPVSKVLAGVTYLLALGSQILGARKSLAVPVFIGDSVQWNQFEENFDGGSFEIPLEAQDVASGHISKSGTLFSMGDSLILPLDRSMQVNSFDALILELSELAKLYVDKTQKKEDVKRILGRHGVSQSEHVDGYEKVFHQLCELNADGRDHIWGYFIRNQIRPLWMSRSENRFDVLIGNPPWLRYNLMSKEMQGAYRELCVPRNLWKGEKYSSRQDLVSLFIVRAIEKYLKTNGSFAFLTPRSVLRAPVYEGFRSGVWSNEAYFETPLTGKFTEVWDLADWKDDLFPVPSAALFGKRDETVGWPSTSVRLNKKDPLLRDKVLAVGRTGDEKHESPYGALALQGATLSPFYMFFVRPTEEPKHGFLAAPAGTRYAVSERSPHEANGKWGKMPGIEGFVEEEFFHEVVTGDSLVAFGIRDTKTAILPIAGGEFQENISELDIRYPNFTDRWLACDDLHMKHAKNMSLLSRVDYQRTLRKQIPVRQFRVVYNASGSNIYPAKLVGVPWVVSNACNWIHVDSEEEADYLVAILSSDHLISLVNPLQASGNFGPRHIHRIPFELPIPRFDSQVQAHLDLSELGRVCAEKVASYLSLSATSLKRQRSEIRAILGPEMSKIDEMVRRFL